MFTYYKTFLFYNIILYAWQSTINHVTYDFFFKVVSVKMEKKTYCI